MRTIHLKLSHHAYDIQVGCEVREALGTVIRGLGEGVRGIVVTDEHVIANQKETLCGILGLEGVVAEPHVIRPGDQSKSMDELARLWDRLGAEKIARDGFILGVGGGVVSDLGAFAAATWMRGVRWVAVPTTLEAMIDASIGGKTGINTAHGKNMVGAFWHPTAVLNDLSFLETLPTREYAAGLAESIKHALIVDAAFLEWHEKNADAILSHDRDVVEELVARNCAIKARVVMADEREERGVRECLNFGHTVGHAIEKAAEYSLRHGECVGLGMLAACRISAARGMIGEDLEGRVRTLLERFGLPTKMPGEISKERVLELIGSDKKARGRRVRFVLLDGVGKWKLVGDVIDEEIQAGIEAPKMGGRP